MVLVKMGRVASATGEQATAKSSRSLILDILTITCLSPADRTGEIPIDDVLPKSETMATTERGIPACILIYGVAAHDNAPACPSITYRAAIPPPDADLYMGMDEMDDNAARSNRERTAP